MILSLSNAQKFYLGNVEISKILFNNAEVFSSIATDPYIDFVKLLTHFDTNFLDTSTNNFILSAFGNTQISTSIKKFGNGSSFFDGSGDYLEAPLDIAFDLEAASFTIECWFYTTNSNWQTILARWGSGGNAFFLGVDQSNQGIQFYLNDAFVCGGGSISLSTWNHVAIVRSGTNILYFLNGTLIQNVNWGSQSIDSSTEKLRIGSDNNINPYFNGYIDELRITKGVARYTSNFIPQTAPFANPVTSFPTTDLLAFYNFQGNILDSVGTISPLITGNSCSLNYTMGINGTSAIQFNNFGTCASTGGGIVVGGAGVFCPNNVWDIFQGNTKASFAFWFKYTQNIPLVNPVNAGCGMTFFGSDFGRFGFGVAPNNGVINNVTCYIAANASGSARYTDPSPIVVGQWNHIAGTYDNTTRNFRVYRNGNLVHNHTFPSTIFAPIENYSGFGINGSGFIQGSNVGEYGIPIIIDSVGLWTRVLTNQDISILYNNGLGREM